MHLVITFLLVALFSNINAQLPKTTLYKGFINNKLGITLYIKTDSNTCGAEILYTGMYTYNHKKKWIQLDINHNHKNQFLFSEKKLTGIMLLQKTPKGFTGLWISPDTKKQLKVIVNQYDVKPTDIEYYDKEFEKLNYENNDC
jgi:hypothetical protein